MIKEVRNELGRISWKVSESSVKADGIAVVESFWGTMKEEGIEGKVFSTHKEAKEALFEYVEIFYNRKRRYSFLGYVSPTDYEEIWKTRKQKEERYIDKSL